MRITVMPEWIAGIQIRRMRAETSMSAWIPALHAGMTQSRASAKLTEARPPPFFKGGREEHEVKKMKCNNFRTLRDLRALRGDVVFSY